MSATISAKPGPPGSPSPWPRRLRWIALLALLSSPPVLWWTSGHFRLVLYELAYPHLSSENQSWAFERIREDEERPDVAWRCYARADDDPAAAWNTVFSACQGKGAFEFRGLEDDLVAVLDDPALAEAHGRALWAAIDCRVKDPRLPPILIKLLDDPELAVPAAFALAVNGRHERALTILIRALEQPLGPNGEAPAADKFDAVGPPLAALRRMGRAGRPALAAIRPWATSTDRSTRQMAMAALCAVDGDPRSHEQLKAALDDPGQDPWFVAVLLADCGLGDAAVLRALEESLENQAFDEATDDPVTIFILSAFAQLEALDRPAPSVLERYLRHKDPAIRDLARRAIAAIENR